MENTLLNLVPASYLPEVHLSQYDVGRVLKFTLKDGSSDYTVPNGAVVTVKATKPSGLGFVVNAVAEGSVVTLSNTETMTNENGRFPAELSIVSGNTTIGTSNFIFNIERSPHPEGTIDGDAESLLPELTLLVERVEAAASSILDMEVEADTLPAGSQASYSYDEELNKATFGIPQGEPGSGAIGTVASAYDATKTYAIGDYAIHDNNLYRCITAITTAEAFTASHWTKIVLADDVTDLKNDLTPLIIQINGEINIELLLTDVTENKYITSTGAISNSNAYCYGFVDVGGYEEVIVDTSAYADTVIINTCDSNKTFVQNVENWANPNKYIVPIGNNIKYLCISSRKTDVNNLSVYVIEGDSSEGIASRLPIAEENIIALRSVLFNSLDNFQTFYGYGNFQHYGLKPDGTFLTTQQYRVSNDDPMTFDRDLTIKVKQGFQWGYIPFVDGNAGTWSGWKTTDFTIPANTPFVVQIARVPENTSEIANVSEFVSALTFDTKAAYEINSLANRTNFDYSYGGEKLIINKGKYNIVDTSVTLPSPSTLGSGNSQGFAIYDGKLVQFYNNANKVALIDMANSQVIASFDSNVGHGNTVDFLDSFVDDSDPFPIAIVADGLSNIAYEIRIQTTGVTVRKTIVFPVENCGYYASTMVDKLNHFLYTVGYSANSYTDSANNKMIIAKWNYDNLTNNGDDTYTPEFVEKFNVPFINTLQAPTFYNGKLFIMSSKASLTEADTKVYVIDPAAKCFTSLLDDFPSKIKNEETEAIYFYDDGEQVCGYINTSPLKKLVFNS